MPYTVAAARAAVLILVSLAVIVVIETLANRELGAAWAFFLSSPVAALASICVLTAGLVVADALVGRCYVGSLPVGFLCVGIAYISGAKLSYLSEPLYPWDFVFARQVIDLLPALFRGSSIRELVLFGSFVGTLLLLFFVLGFVSRRAHPIARWPRALLAFLAIPFFAGSIWLTAPLQRDLLFELTGLRNFAWNQPYNYKTNGFVLASLLNLKSGLIFPPINYGEERIASVLRLMADRETTPSRSEKGFLPNVVLIMSEAFWDPTLLPGVRFSSDPVPFWHDPIAGAKRGWIFSPQEFGGTANVEFEALTGLTNAFLPAGSIPYQQYIRADTLSLPGYLAQLGYRTIAMHPYPKWFWNRMAVYKHLGFQSFFGIEDMQDRQLRGPFTSDRFLMQQALSVVRTTAEPLFLFVVTMQNHGPYEANRFGKEQVHASGALRDEQLASLSTFAQGAKEAEASLRSFLEELETLRKPTLVVFFGDHLPYLGPRADTYVATGYISASRDLSYADLAKMRKTPLLIWSNFEARTPPFEVLSPAFIPALVSSALRLEHPFFTNFLGDLLATVPVIDRRMISSSQGVSHLRDRQVAMSVSGLIDNYEALQFDILFGAKTSYSLLFCDNDPRLCRPKR